MLIAWGLPLERNEFYQNYDENIWYLSYLKYTSIFPEKKKKTEISRILFESSKSMNLQCLIGQIL